MRDRKSREKRQSPLPAGCRKLRAAAALAALLAILNNVRHSHLLFLNKPTTNFAKSPDASTIRNCRSVDRVGFRSVCFNVAAYDLNGAVCTGSHGGGCASDKCPLEPAPPRVCPDKNAVRSPASPLPRPKRALDFPDGHEDPGVKPGTAKIFECPFGKLFDKSIAVRKR